MSNKLNIVKTKSLVNITLLYGWCFLLSHC